MKFRYQFERVDDSTSQVSLAVDAVEAVEVTVAALDQTHAADASTAAVVAENAESEQHAVVSFEIADGVSLDDMRALLGRACAARGLYCPDLNVAPNPQLGLPGGDAG